jgi:hypothetical protein
MALSEASYLIYGVARSLLGIILGILCIVLGIILGISRILSINISELSKRDPNHKKRKKPRPLQ